MCAANYIALMSKIFSAAFAEYILMTPSDDYRPFMDAMKEKTYISKVSGCLAIIVFFYSFILVSISITVSLRWIQGFFGGA